MNKSYLQDNNEIEMLSVNELNEVLKTLQEGKTIKPLGTFTEVDIVFVAGLFLWYMQHRDSWTKLSLSFNITKKLMNHSHYFQQIFELYNIRHNDIFINFPNAYSKDANSFSRYFAPPIFITEKSFKYFFGKEVNSRIDRLKNKYISNFYVTDFVSKVFKEYIKFANEFEEYEAVIKQRLESISPIFTFIFIITCKRLAQKSNWNLIETKDYIEKIWQFTKEYCFGLYELAKNIVEHSGKTDFDDNIIEKGQGIITIRAYDPDKKDDITKVLETHVFDYGESGIFTKLNKNTIKKVKDETDKAINRMYTEDLKILQNNYSLTDFIEPTDKFLYQQFYRDMAHYGLMNFKHLIINRHKGKVIASSIRMLGNNTREYYPLNVTEMEKSKYCIEKGTSYYFEMPFDKEIFKDTVYITQQQDYSHQSVMLGLEKIQEIAVINKKDIDFIIREEDKKEKKYLTDLYIKGLVPEDNNIDREYENKIFNCIIQNIDTTLQEDNNYIALNFDGMLLDKSNLLRILARLSREKNIPKMIVYNLDFDIFDGLIKDNIKWFDNIKDKWETPDGKTEVKSFWEKDKCVLFFTKYNDFYFADMLYGKNKEEFDKINIIISNTFPNAVEISGYSKNDLETKEITISAINCLKPFFYNNSLLPFDVILENNKHKKLFLSNLERFLQNPLTVKDREYKYENQRQKNLLNKYIYTFDGYHIDETHFKIGAKLHSEDFFYAKRLFLNSFYTARMAMLIAVKIKNEFKNISTTEDILLVGYEMYSELLLSLIRKFLNDMGYSSIKHIIGIERDGKYFIKADGEIFWYDNIDNKILKKCFVIIIVPIASTGSTAVKIKEVIINKAKKMVKEELKKNGKSGKDLKLAIEEQIKNINFDYKETNNNVIESKDFVINIITAQDFEKIKIVPEIKYLVEDNNKKQKRMIELNVSWHLPENCKFCGFDKDSNFLETRPLFSTDKSYLTPALIFDKPRGKIIPENANDKTSLAYLKDEEEKNEYFKNIDFKTSLKYKKIIRNNEYFLFSINTPIFINKNRKYIIKWLNNLHKEFYNTDDSKIKINFTDQVILLAPCHETNSEFLNIVNENVFNSSATIIHHQIGIDFIENFKLLNYKILNNDNKKNKIFYVDDNLISSKSFFNIYNLFRNTVNDNDELVGAILLRDSSTQETHDLFLKTVNHCRTFIAYNLPPSVSFDSRKPLEHERKRYSDMMKFALHDVLIKVFAEKEKDFDVEDEKRENSYFLRKITTEEEKKARENELIIKTDESKIRHLKMFLTTHNIYKYFINNNITDNIDKELMAFCYNEIDINENENMLILLKVLSQYPFILYKPLKIEVFKIHKNWLEKRIIDFSNKLENNIKNDKNKLEFNEETEYLNVFSFSNFCEFKYLIRRAVFLDNLQIVDTSFLAVLSKIFEHIDKNKIKKYKKIMFDYKQECYSYDQNDILKSLEDIDIINNLGFIDFDNLKDFHIFLVKNYLELAHKNGWAAVKLMENIVKIEQEFKTGKARQFLRMLRMELSAVTNDFYNLIIFQHDKEWRDIFRDEEELVDDTNKIYQFIENKKFKDSNKYLILEKLLSCKLLLENNQIEYLPFEYDKFINFLWIKQLIHADTHPESYFPKKYSYQEKLNAIIKKMKEFFPNKDKIKSFFIVTDGQQKPHALIDEDGLLLNFCEEYREDIKIITDFLQGDPCNTRKAPKSTIEYVHLSDYKWKNIYNNETEELKFIQTNMEYKWLYLIRISDYSINHEFETQGLLCFYSTNNYNDNIFPKQLLMLLRKDMSKFISKHHKNDEFSGWIKQIEKNDYQIMLKHGIDTYDSPIKYYNENIVDDNPNRIDINYLFSAIDWLNGRTILLGILNKIENGEFDERNYEKFSVKTLINNILNNYKYILSFHNTKLDFFSDRNINDVDNLIEIVDDTCEEDKNIVTIYPKKLKEQIIFEVIYNIRKHVLSTYYDIILEKENKIKINLNISKYENVTYFTITNNFCCKTENELERNKSIISNKDDGLNLIYNILKKINLGKVFIKIENMNKDAEKNKFIINIPLIQGDNEYD